MSQFKTTIPVHIEDIIKQLPPGAGVDSLNVQGDLGQARVEIVLVWSHDGLRAQFTTGNEFSLHDLKAKVLPAGVTAADKPEAPTEARKTRRGGHHQG